MLLLRDQATRARACAHLDRHLAVIDEVFAGTRDLRALQAAKLADMLRAAAGAELYRDVLREWLDDDGARLDPSVALDQVFPSLPLVSRCDLGLHDRCVLTRDVGEFMHYFESSGTTGDPVAAPKAIDDLLVNTANLGEMWARFLRPEDVGLILISAPFAPAPYQFEKALEYVGVMSLRVGVSYLTGDYTRVLKLVDDLRANVFVGAPSRLLEMLQFAMRRGMSAPRFDRLLLIAEQTGPSFLRHLERLTGAVAFVGSYGSSETGTIAVSCERGRLHAQLQSYLLELRDADGTRMVDGAADRGELVVTTLDLPARPLLRYCMGDLVEITGERCPCGLALPVLRTRGRTQDVLAMPGGALRQEDFEAGLWANGASPTALNYMLIIRRPDIVCLATTDQPADALWEHEIEQRLSALFPAHRLTVRAVDALPPVASLGGDLGWKLARVVDLDNERAWDRLPATTAEIVQSTLEHLGKDETWRAIHIQAS